MWMLNFTEDEAKVEDDSLTMTIDAQELASKCTGGFWPPKEASKSELRAKVWHKQGCILTQMASATTAGDFVFDVRFGGCVCLIVVLLLFLFCYMVRRVCFYVVFMFCLFLWLVFCSYICRGCFWLCNFICFVTIFCWLCCVGAVVLPIEVLVALHQTAVINLLVFVLFVFEMFCLCCVCFDLFLMCVYVVFLFWLCCLFVFVF